MHTFEISLLVDGIHPEDSDKLEALLQVCENAYVSSIDGQTRVTAVLAGSSVVAAVFAFVKAARAAIPDFVAHKAELQLVTVSDIAEQVGLNRESVRLWTTGKRGPGNFPSALSTVTDGRMKIWALSDVEAWLRRHSLPSNEARAASMDEVCKINDMLACEHIAEASPQLEWTPSSHTTATVAVSSTA